MAAVVHSYFFARILVRRKAYLITERFILVNSPDAAVYGVRVQHGRKLRLIADILAGFRQGMQDFCGGSPKR